MPSLSIKPLYRNRKDDSGNVTDSLRSYNAEVKEQARDECRKEDQYYWYCQYNYWYLSALNCNAGRGRMALNVLLNLYVVIL